MKMGTRLYKLMYESSYYENFSNKILLTHDGHFLQLGALGSFLLHFGYNYQLYVPTGLPWLVGHSLVQ